MFIKFWDNVGNSSYFPMPLLYCLCHVSFSRYAPLILKVVTIRTNVKAFGPQFFSGGMTPTFLRQVVSAIYHPPFDKVWFSSSCWYPSAKPGNEVECRIYGGWVKTHLQFEAVSEPKFMSFWDDVGDPLWFSMHLPAYASCFIPKI